LGTEYWTDNVLIRMKARGGGAHNYQGLWLLISLLASENGKNTSSACNMADQKITKIHILNDGEVSAVTRGIHLKEGQFLYGQLTVSPSQTSWSILVTTSWPRYTWEVPVWVYLRHKNLPTSTYFDKTGISYLTQQKSVVKMDSASAGVYYIAVEARVSIANLTITVDILPRRQANEVLLLEEWSQLNEILVK